MRKFVLLCAGAAGLVLLLGAAGSGERSISLAELRDKIEGGWAGQMIGVSYGAPTEFRWKEKMIEGELPEWTPDRVTNSIKQDDLYVDMTFAQVLDDKGLDASSEDFGAMFKDAKYSLWHANLAARRALRRGVPGTLSGTPKYNAHANDIDFQIEADFIGLMAPGLPVAATDIAWRAGRVMNYGDGVYGGILMSCMYSVAFFETDPHKVVEEGLKCLPAKSPYAMLISDVLAWHKENPTDWTANWRKIEQKWNKREPCPDGAMRPFNIDAKLNGAYVVLGLLYGDGDFFKTADVSTRAGQDSDCNPATACGILGTMRGYKWIPDKWKSSIVKIADTKFDYTNYTFRTIVDSTEKRAIALAKKTGGRVEGQSLIIKGQVPKETKLELWDDYGSPAERIAASDARWQWKGNWRAVEGLRTAKDRGAEASIAFEGTGAMIVGPYLVAGGKAEVYLDGKLDRVIDVYPDEPDDKGGESVWHAFKLAPGKHTLRLVVTGEPYSGSKGAEVAVEDLVVFR